MFFLGMLSSWLDFGTLIWMINSEIQHEFSDCPCKARQKKGLDTLAKHRPEGRSQLEVLSVLGKPEGISTIESGKQSSGYPRTEEIWHYRKYFIVLHFERKKCVLAFPCTGMWH
jgi:hypothetical protein